MSIKNNQKYHINHQTQSDLTGEWFNFDKKFKARRFTAFISYKINLARKTSSNWFILKLKQFEIKILQFNEFMSKNIITILTAILIILGLGGATAQAFAPENLKPLALYQKLFAANKQVERDPYTSIKPDTNNFVTSLDQCDLSLKYPKVLSDGSILGVYRESIGAKEENPLLIEAFRLQTESFSGGALTNFDFNVQCFEPSYEVPNYGFPVNLITKQELQEKTGWFITQADIKDIKSSRNFVYGSVAGTGEEIQFIYQNKKYLVSSISKTLKSDEIDQADLEKYYGDKLPQDFTDKSSGVFANQVQLQFNSLVTNLSDKNVMEKPKAAQNTKSSNVIEAQPVDKTLEKSVFRPNEGCYQGFIEEGLMNLPDEPIYSYFSEIDQKNAQMVVSNRNYGFKAFEEFEKTPVAKFDAFINSNKLDTGEDGQKLLNPINVIFNNSCGGAQENYNLDLNPLKYGDKTKPVLAWGGQDAPLLPIVFVYAQKGDDLILLSSPLFLESETRSIIKSCGFDFEDPNSDFANFDQSCYQNTVTSDINLKKANDLVQKLTTKFKLK